MSRFFRRGGSLYLSSLRLPNQPNYHCWSFHSLPWGFQLLLWTIVCANAYPRKSPSRHSNIFHGHPRNARVSAARPARRSLLWNTAESEFMLRINATVEKALCFARLRLEGR